MTREFSSNLANAVGSGAVLNNAFPWDERRKLIPVRSKLTGAISLLEVRSGAVGKPPPSLGSLDLMIALANRGEKLVDAEVRKFSKQYSRNLVPPPGTIEISMAPGAGARPNKFAAIAARTKNRAIVGDG